VQDGTPGSHSCETMRIIDTHLHLIYPDRFTYPWLADSPPLNRAWPAEAYWAEASSLDIEAALHMEVDVAPGDMFAETAFMLDVHPKVVGATANGRPEDVNFIPYLERLAALRRVKGIRRLLQFQPPELTQSPFFLDNVRQLPRFGFCFDVCVKSHELEVAKSLIAACPDVQFILDHCGNPKIGEWEWGPWAGQVLEIAAFPNVVCKISGILANVTADWTVDELRPYVEHAIACFGWDRVVWGSDHPVVTLFADLRRWVEATREIIAGASLEEQAKLLHGNAERLYRLG
jgi:predicted TIM-barrel fold metal-dependent hydrolase